MNPLLLSALLSFAPSLFSGLFGGDPNRKLRSQVNRLTSPQNVANLTGQFYNQAIGGPAYSQAQGAIAQGANQAANQVAQNLGARGIGTTGTAAVLSGLTPSLVGSQQAGLRSAAYQGAQSQAQKAIQAQIEALTQQGLPSQQQQLFAGGLDAFTPFLQDYLRKLLAGSTLGGGLGGYGLPNPALNEAYAGTSFAPPARR